MSHKVSYKWFRRTLLIPELGVFYNVWWYLLGECLTVKNYVGVIHRGLCELNCDDY